MANDLPTSPEFKAAAAAVKNFREKPTNAELLELYALYKTATRGKNTDPRPDGYFDFEGKAKWDAWTELSGKDVTPEEAQADYIALYESKKTIYG